MSMNIQALRLQSSVLQPLANPQAASVEKAASSPEQRATVENVFSPAEVVSRLTRALRSSEALVRPDKVQFGREIAAKTGYPSDNVLKEVASDLLGQSGLSAR
jgi:hypothetical protein